jgi:hypothetical protein
MAASIFPHLVFSASVNPSFILSADYDISFPKWNEITIKRERMAFIQGGARMKDNDSLFLLS